MRCAHGSTGNHSRHIGDAKPRSLLSIAVIEVVGAKSAFASKTYESTTRRRCALYGIKDDRIYLTVIAPDDNAVLPDGVQQHQIDGRSSIVSTLRWGPFTQAAVQLQAAGYQFKDISGNRRIVISAVGPKNQEPPSTGAAELFESGMVSDPTQERHVMLVEVGQLANFLRDLKASPVRLEHIYDY